MPRRHCTGRSRRAGGRAWLRCWSRVACASFGRPVRLADPLWRKLLRGPGTVPGERRGSISRWVRLRDMTCSAPVRSSSSTGGSAIPAVRDRAGVTMSARDSRQLSTVSASLECRPRRGQVCSRIMQVLPGRDYRRPHRPSRASAPRAVRRARGEASQRRTRSLPRARVSRRAAGLTGRVEADHLHAGVARPGAGHAPCPGADQHRRQHHLVGDQAATPSGRPPTSAATSAATSAQPWRRRRR